MLLNCIKVLRQHLINQYMIMLWFFFSYDFMISFLIWGEYVRVFLEKYIEIIMIICGYNSLLIGFFSSFGFCIILEVFFRYIKDQSLFWSRSRVINILTYYSNINLPICRYWYLSSRFSNWQIFHFRVIWDANNNYFRIQFISILFLLGYLDKWFFFHDFFLSSSSHLFFLSRCFLEFDEVKYLVS